LYSLNKKRDAVARFFRVSHNRAAAFEPTSAIFPKHVAPVVRQADDGEREIVTMSWGFMLLQNGRAPRAVTNVRDDTILLEVVLREATLSRAGVVVLRTERRRKAGDVALVLAYGRRRAAALCFSRHLAQIQGPDEKGPTSNIETYAFLTRTASAMRRFSVSTATNEDGHD